MVVYVFAGILRLSGFQTWPVRQFLLSQLIEKYKPVFVLFVPAERTKRRRPSYMITDRLTFRANKQVRSNYIIWIALVFFSLVHLG